VIANARARQQVKVWGYCKDGEAREWRKAQARHFKAKRQAERRDLAVRMFKALALVVAALGGFCAATFGVAR
jgi:hypothetical protein